MRRGVLVLGAVAVLALAGCESSPCDEGEVLVEDENGDRSCTSPDRATRESRMRDAKEADRQRAIEWFDEESEHQATRRAGLEADYQRTQEAWATEVTEEELRRIVREELDR